MVLLIAANSEASEGVKRPIRKLNMPTLVLVAALPSPLR